MSEATAASHKPRPFDVWDGVFAVIAVVGFVVITWMGLQATFWQDDWKFFGSHVDEALPFLEPYHDHWIATLVAYQKPLLATIGLSAYWPYLLPLTFAHVATATALYWGGRRLGGAPAGLAAGTLMLVLGSAGILLFMSGAFNFIMPAALGAWALVLVIAGGRARLIAASVMLLLAVMSGGAALAFLLAVVVYLLFAEGRWRDLWVAAPATIVFALWYLTFGRSDSLAALKPTLGQSIHVAEWVSTGPSVAMGVVTGLRAEIGLILVVIVAVATLWHLLGSKTYVYAALAAMAGLFGYYLVLSVSALGEINRAADAPRYTYASAVFILIAVVSLYGAMPRRRPLNSLPLLAIVAWAILANAIQLRWFVDEWLPDRWDNARAIVQIMRDYDETGQLKQRPEHPDPMIRQMLTPGVVKAVTDRYGIPPGTEDASAEAIERNKELLLDLPQESPAPTGETAD